MNPTYSPYAPINPKVVFRLKQIATDAASDLSGMFPVKARSKKTVASVVSTSATT